MYLTTIIRNVWSALQAHVLDIKPCCVFTRIMFSKMMSANVSHVSKNLARVLLVVIKMEQRIAKSRSLSINHRRV